MSKLLEEGDIIELKEGHEIFGMIPNHFIFTNMRGNWELHHSHFTIGGEFNYFAGKYIVYKTVNEPSGTGHGRHDIYPGSYHVYCESIDRPDLKVDFHQTGCCNGLIEDITPIGKATRKWVTK